MANIDAALEQQILDVAQRRGYRTYICTAKRITSGDELKHRNRLARLLISTFYQPPSSEAILV